MKGYLFDVPEGAWITADKADTDYTLEDVLTEAGRTLSLWRKVNAKRAVPPWVTYLQSTYRKSWRRRAAGSSGSCSSPFIPSPLVALS